MAGKKGSKHKNKRKPKLFCVRGHEIAVVGRYSNGKCAQCGRDDANASYIFKPKKQFCPHGHDTFICGRDSNRYCKNCSRNKRREYYNKNKKQIFIRRKPMIRKTKLHQRYGITVEQYNKMFDMQQGKCAICGRHQDELKRVLFIDHNHITKKVRGLLCQICNVSLGGFKDSLELLQKAMGYLKLYD